MTTHLMVRSCYTLLGSTIRIKELVSAAKELGYTTLALTDHNTCSGLAPFSHACKEAGIHPIYGLELDVSLEEETVPFLLLARTTTGYGNLMRLSSFVQCEGNPVPFSQFAESLEGVSVIVYGEGGWLESPLLAEDRDELNRRLDVLQSALPSFDVGLSYMDSLLWKRKNRLLKEVSRGKKLSTCAINKIFYLKPDEAKIHQMLRGIAAQRTLRDSSLPSIHGRYLLSPEEMAGLYEADDLERTDELARRCQAEVITAKAGLPSYPGREGLTSSQLLTQLCLAGLNRRLHGNVPPEYKERLKYELDVISRMNFSDYFLIVYDFILFARKQGIYVGPGRGSAAGCLAAYCLGITMVDPIKYGLLFERFLNPERVSMPDIDTDIPDNRRAEVIHYVAEKYGLACTGGIITFNTLGARQVLRDLGKVMELPTRDVDMLCRMIPSGQKTTLRSALMENNRLREIVKAEPRYTELFRAAAKLEGLPRHSGIHPAGILLSNQPLDSVIPLAPGEDGMVISQYTAEYLEERGLIKMDFLGLRNLTMIDSMVKKIQETEPEFQILNLPEADEATFDIFRHGDTNGIFQFESEGMKRLLRQMHPDRFEDVVAAMALFRPASSDSIPNYLEGKKHPEQVAYPSKQLEPVLKDTFGVMIYQEQSMKTAQVAAGFTLAQADRLRKAMSKKKTEELEGMKESFVKGCLSNGYSKEQAEHLFELVRRFGGYGFNKSHAVAYGMIAWQTAYLKAHYPLIFYSSLMDSLIGDSTRISQYVDECRKKGIRILAPDVNRSDIHCLIEDDGIRLPLSMAKGVGTHAAIQIKEIQEQRPFEDYFDFVARVSVVLPGTAVIEALIDAGALDCFLETRTTMRESLNEAISYGELIRIEQNGQIVLDDSLVSRPLLMKRYDDRESNRERELQVLGFSLGPHPILEVRAKKGIRCPSLIELSQQSGIVNGFGYIGSFRTHQTKKGEKMAFVKVSDETCDLELLLMPRQFSMVGETVRKGMYILFDGKMTEDGKCIIRTLTPLTE